MGVRKVNINKMERVVFVAEIGSVTEAANRLRISQPSLSQMIQAIEEDIGLPLFDRRHQPMTLTYAGEKYVQIARQIIKQSKQLEEELKGIKKGQIGRIVIGISQRRIRQIMPYLVPELRKQLPNIQCELVDGTPLELEKWLLQGRIDLYFGGVAPNEPKVETTRLCNEYLLLAVPRTSQFYKTHMTAEYSGGTKWQTVSISDAANEKFILLMPSNRIRNLCNQIFLEHKITPDVFMELDSSDIALDLIASSSCATIAPTILPNDMNIGPLLRSDVAYFMIDTAYSVQDLFMIYSRDAYFTNAHRAFIDIAKNVFGYQENQL